MGGGSSSNQATEMATVNATYGNSAGNTIWDNSHPRLIDNKISGTTQQEVNLNCAASAGQVLKKRAFLSMELDAPKKVVKVQLAFRTDGHTDNGKNVRIQVGTGPQYNASDPVCRDIGQLTGVGFMDYVCDKVHVGKYVILSNDQNYLLICEAKVFVEPINPYEDFTAMYNSSSKSWRLSFFPVESLKFNPQ